jgi:hypothetical protein
VGVGSQCYSSAVLPPGKRSVTRFTGGWVGSRVSVGGCGKSRPTGIFFLNSLAFSLYSIRTGFCVLVVLHFAFCLYCKTQHQHPGTACNTKHKHPCLHRDFFALSLYCSGKSLFWLSWLLPFVLTAQHTPHKHPCPRRDSNPQYQQASDRKTSP